LLVIDVQGARQVRSRDETIGIFVLPAAVLGSGARPQQG
jgi:guanylate kinase